MGWATYLQHINDNMSIIDRLISQIAPHDCLSCGREGALLCTDCLGQLPQPSIPHPQTVNLTRVQSVTDYQGVAKDLIWRLKSNGAQAATKIMARQMAQLINKDSKSVIVPVP